MKREIITTGSDGRITIPSDTGNIWMNEMELVELFGVIAPTLRAAIRAVYKCEVLNPLEAEKRIKLPNGYYADMYALPMVVALAFRIDTSSTAMIRNALLKRLCQRKEKQVLLVSMNNRMPYEYIRVNFLCSATTIPMRTSSSGRTRAGRISLTGRRNGRGGEARK